MLQTVFRYQSRVAPRTVCCGSRRAACRKIFRRLNSAAYDVTAVTAEWTRPGQVEQSDLSGDVALYIGATWPEPCSTAAGLRSMSILNVLKAAGCEVNCVASSRLSAAANELNARGIRVSEQHPNDPAFDAFLQSLQPSLVIFDRFTTEEKFSWRVDEHVPNALKILDTQDLHSLRAARETAVDDGINLQDVVHIDLLPASEQLLRELSAIFRSDLTLIISDFEQQLLLQKLQVPEHLLHLQRFSYTPPDPVTNPGFEDRNGFAMIGNFRHHPNVDGVKWFQSQVWPLIRQELPKATMSIYGAYPTADVMKLSSKPDGFRVVGPVKDQYQSLKKHRINVAALRYGAGIKGKITDGWWCGTPCVTTQIGAEGMVDDLPFGGAVADSAEQFAELCVKLYTDQQAWQQAQQRGYQLMARLYDGQANAERLLLRLKQAKEQQQQNRNRNLVGGMLRYYKHRSTMYFSRWIEAKQLVKNRKNFDLEMLDPSS